MLLKLSDWNDQAVYCTKKKQKSMVSVRSNDSSAQNDSDKEISK